jgi:malonate transporter and related proteins
MWSVSLSILPIFLLLMVGYALRRKQFPGENFWAMADKVTYWVLFPALLFFRTTTAPLNGDIVGPYAIALMGALIACSLLAVISARVFNISNPVAGSLFQGSMRHNTFIAFATADMLYGADGLLLAAVATSILVPPTNLFAVSALVIYQGNNDGKLKRRLVQEIARNPLLIAIAAGITLNLTGIGPLPVLHDMAGILSRAALPFALLCVGAGLHIQGIRADYLSMVISTIGKLLIFPLMMLGVIFATGLDGMPAVILLIYGAVPTATSGYALARQLDSDAEVTAAIITVQTLISMVTLPIVVTLASQYFTP